MPVDGKPLVPREAFLQAWTDMTPEQRAEGARGARDEHAFADMLLAEGVWPVFVWDHEKQRVCFAAWLNQIGDGWAHAHFTGVGKYEQGMAEAVMAFWEKLPLTGLVGLIPTANRKARRLVDVLGWVEVGEIPKLFNRSEPGMMHYYLIGG